MWRTWRYSRALAFLAGLMLAAAFRPPPELCCGEIFSARVSRIHDGDTVSVTADDGRVLKIRLYGIDAPESGQAFGRVAKKHLTGLLRGQRVRVESFYLDDYQRRVALLYYQDHRLANADLVAAGLAWYAPQFCRKTPVCPRIKALEKNARQQKLGLWRDKEPRPPWEWRRDSGRK